MANFETIQMAEEHLRQLVILGGAAGVQASAALKDIRNLPGGPSFWKPAGKLAVKEVYMPYITAANSLIIDYYMKNRELLPLDNLDLNRSILTSLDARKSTAIGVDKEFRESEWEDDKFFDNFDKELNRVLISGMQMQNDDYIRSIGKQDKNFDGNERFARVGACRYCLRTAGTVPYSIYHKNCGCGSAPRFKV